jgi:acetyl esterase/lipase
MRLMFAAPAGLLALTTCAPLPPLIAPRHSLDLHPVAVSGHSAGGHLALWAAARDPLPAKSPVPAVDPLPIRDVVSLAGIVDLASDRETGPDACGGPSTIDALFGVRQPGGRDVLRWRPQPALATGSA